MHDAVVEQRKFPKNLVELTAATDRWQSEGGIVPSPQEPGLVQDTALRALEEKILRCLGAAVILQWKLLPATAQQRLLDDAAALAGPRQMLRLRREIALFLHEHESDQD